MKSSIRYGLFGVFFSISWFFGSAKPCLGTPSESHYYRDLFQKEELVDGLKMFLTHIFNVYSPEKTFPLVERVVRDHPNDSDEDVYKEIQKKASKIRGPIAEAYGGYLSLGPQIQVLTEQTKELIGPKEIKGYLEIGTTGRYVKGIKKLFNVKGTVFLTNDVKSPLKDIVERGLQSPGTFFYMEDYKPISEDLIPDQSLDLVTCFIGLHHVPPAKLEAYIDSIARVLKPGGSLILRDHDYGDYNAPLVHLAHSVYNVFLGETLQNEVKEVRNFQSLTYWIDLLEKHGIKFDGKKLFQKNDPTSNALMSFTRVASSKEVALFHLNERLSNDNSYRKDLKTSYSTIVEWGIVYIVQDMAKFLESSPWEKYPYQEAIDHMEDLNKKMKKEIFDRKQKYSYFSLTDAARKENFFMRFSTARILKNLRFANQLSDDQVRPMATVKHIDSFSLVVQDKENVLSRSRWYQFMKEDMGSSRYLVAIPSGESLAEFLKFIKVKKINILASSSKNLIYTIIRDLGKFLEHTPWYDYPLSELDLLFSKIEAPEVGEGPILRPLTKAELVPINGFKKFFGKLSYWASWFNNQKDNLMASAPLTIRMVVEDAQNIVSSIDDRIKIIEKASDGFKVIEVPRYIPFMEIIKKLAERHVSLVDIGGSKKIHVLLNLDHSQKNIMASIEGCQELFDYELPTSKSKIQMSVDINLKHLSKVFERLKKEDIQIKHIYDFY